MTKPKSRLKRITVEEINKSNTNLFRFDKTLWSALRKERFSKARPEAYNEHCFGTGILGYTDPSEEMEMKMVIDVYTSALSDQHKEVWLGFLMGMKQADIAAAVGVCQGTVSNHLKKLIADFAEFYKKEELWE